MDDHGSLRDLLARNQEGMAGAAGLQIFFAMIYAVVRQLDLWKSIQAIVIGALFAATLWLVLAEMLKLEPYYIVLVSIGCGFGAYPLVNAYVKRSDALADGAFTEGIGFLKRWVRRLGGGT